MFLARIIPGRKPEVFPLTGALFVQHPRSWAFCSYRKGACAIGYTREAAQAEAVRRLETSRQVRIGTNALQSTYMRRGSW